MKQDIDMKNRLGEMWRKNTRALLKHYGMGPSELQDLTGLSSSTLQANFGGNMAKNYASPKTIGSIERAFRLPSGALSKPGFNPVTAESKKPAPPAPPQMPSITIPFSQDKLERIMRIVYEED